MKKIFLLLTLICFFAFTNNKVMAQWKTSGCIVEQTTPNADGLVWENDSIKFKFSPYTYSWGIRIENKSNISISVLWDEVLFVRAKRSSNIIFDDTIMLYIDKPKGESIIAGGTLITKSILPRDVVYNGSISPIFYKSTIKKEGPMNIRLIFPVMVENQKRIYEFTFTVSLPKK